MKQSFFGVLVVILGCLASCSDDGDSPGALFISTEQQKQLGMQFDSTILAHPEEYPILSEEDYPQANNYLQGIFNEILQSEAIDHRDDFDWQIRLIEDDSVLNAFATPGGYVYVYTGLIKYLEQEDDLAGVLGHEIAHAAEEHSARSLERQYGLQLLTSILLGNDSGTLTEIVTNSATGLLSLSYGRNLEAEADERSVDYLAETKYNCAGASSFFQKLIEQGQTGGGPTFLSTHPDPGNRVEDIVATAQEVGCSTEPADPSSYDDFKAMLPGE